MRFLAALALAGCVQAAPPLPPEPVLPPVNDPAACPDSCARAQKVCPTRAAPIGSCVTTCNATAPDLGGSLDDLTEALTCNP